MAPLLAGGAAYPESFSADRRAGRAGWADVVVITRGEAFHAHAIVLANASKYLAQRLSEAVALPRQRRVLLELHEAVPPETFELVLDFLYLGRVELRDELQLPELLDAALKLQLPELQAATVAALEQHLTVSTCIAAWELAERANIHMLESSARQVALTELMQLSGIDVSKLTTLPPARVRSLLADARLGTGEKRVFEGLVQLLAQQRASSSPQRTEMSSPSPTQGKLWINAAQTKVEAARRMQRESAVQAKAQADARGSASSGQARAADRVKAEARARATAASTARVKAVRTGLISRNVL